MKLTRIQALNLKGRSFDYELAPLILLTGSNFSGKTSVIESVRLILLGHIPECGKRPSDTFELSSGSVMSVVATFDDGTQASRSFEQNGTGIKQTSNDLAEELAGADLPLLNAEHYFSLSDKARVDYIFSKIELPASYTRDGIIARLQQISFGEEHSEQVEKAKAAGIDAVSTFDKPSIQENLEGARDHLKGFFTYWNKREKETSGTVKTLTELKLREKEFSAETIGSLETAIATRQMVINDLREKRGAAVARSQEWNREYKRREEIEEKLARPAVDHSARIAAFEKDIAALRLIKSPSKEEIKAATEKATTSYQVSSRKEREIADAREAIAVAKNELGRSEELVCCPFCKSKEKNWRQTLVEHFQAIIDRHADFIKANEADAANAVEIHRKNLAEHDAIAGLAEQAVEAACKAARFQSEIDRLRGLEAENTRSRAEWQESIKTPQGPQPSYGDIEADLEDAEARMFELRDRHKTALRLQQDLKRAAEANLEHELAAAHVLVLKRLGKELVEIQAEMIEAVFGKLLAIANQITADILPSPLAFLDGEVGRYQEGRFVRHRTFSGTEKALTYIAIAAALSSQAKFKLLILDEIGRLDEGNRVRVLYNLAQAREKGIVDQVIVAGTNPPKLLPDSLGWKRIELK